MLAGAGAALINPLRAHRLPNWLKRGDNFLIAADHDRERRVSSSYVAAGNWRVDARYTALPCAAGDFQRQRRLACAHVDEDFPRLAPRQRPIFAEEHFTNISRKPN